MMTRRRCFAVKLFSQTSLIQSLICLNFINARDHYRFLGQEELTVRDRVYKFTDEKSFFMAHYSCFQLIESFFLNNNVRLLN